MVYNHLVQVTTMERTKISRSREMAQAVGLMSWWTVVALLVLRNLWRMNYSFGKVIIDEINGISQVLVVVVLLTLSSLLKVVTDLSAQ